MDDILAKLRARNAEMQNRDTALGQELDGLRDRIGQLPEVVDAESMAAMAAPVPALAESVADIAIDHGVDEGDLTQESIVRRTGRPVLRIIRNLAELGADDPEAAVWKARLDAVRGQLENAASAVGRIDVVGHSLDWLGTGWLVAKNVIVTNRHVASEFARRSGAGFVFRQGLSGKPMSASIDLLQEDGRNDQWSFVIEEVLHIEDTDGPDLAFCRVAHSGGNQPPAPIIFGQPAQDDELVAVIGYPARDSRIPEQQLMDRIFGNVYNKKRLAPGQVTGTAADVVRHDCSTLGGNSGSVMLSLAEGNAVGVHYAGRFLEANYAVPAAVIQRQLDRALNGTSVSAPVPKPAAPEVPKAPTSQPAFAGSMAMTYLVPLRITVDIDTAYRQSGPAGVHPVPAVASGDDTVFTEAVAADLADREGYQDTFLGKKFAVALPRVVADADVLQFTTDGVTDQVLRYEHFSVVMSKSRRLCHFSAVNINGKLSQTLPRSGWRTDPRIPPGAQIIEECYGNEPQFARGHMTRREDPIWGTGQAPSRGNADSMHVTNVVPQMQTFNAGVWLGLENYALQNARKDQMKISVFTGPFLAEDDPMKFGVPIPVEFWKVIAFRHDQTGELTATGYTKSQRAFFSDDEFVFGEYKTTQTSIATIEQRAGLSFGNLSSHDPFDIIESPATELTELTQIRFL